MAEINGLLSPSDQYKRKYEQDSGRETKRCKYTTPPSTPPRMASTSSTTDWTPESQRIYPLYKKATQLVTPESKTGFKALRNATRALDPNNPEDAKFLSPQKNIPAAVTSHRYTDVLGCPLGGGAQSQTFLTHRLNPKKNSPEKGLVKVSEERISYKQQKKAYKKAGGGRGLDPILATATTTNQPKQRHLLFGIPAEGDITKIKWDEAKKPASLLYSVFRGCVRGLWKMHENDVLHRDIKGLNMLYKMGEEEAEGLITDFGVSKEIPEPNKGRIRGTLEYLPDFVFNEISDQRTKETVGGEEKISSYGIQTKEADVSSLGYALQKDLLLPAIYYALRKENINASLPVTLTTKAGPFTDETMKENAVNHTGRVLYHKPKGDKEEYLMLFTPVGEFGQQTHRALNDLEAGGHDKREISLFRGLVDLSVQMQNPDPSQVPTMESVYKTMKKIQATAEELQD